MKRYTKLLAAVLLLVTAAVMVVTTSFAWMTLSSNPVAQGLQVTLAGSHTILVAPDVTTTQNGRTLHYPGAFSDDLKFFEYEQYGYLQELGGLLPVSTADGEDWYIPTYYQLEDPQVVSGEAQLGQLRPTTDFVMDNMLLNANLTAKEAGDAQGHYAYLDFWVMAPVDGYKLRVSTSAESAGSFVIGLMEPQSRETDGQTTYELAPANEQTTACVRVGFLVNEDTLLDDSMLVYSQSEDFNEMCSRLQGVYLDKGLSALYSQQTHFTIYEPNGNVHPTEVNGVRNGQYVPTRPLGAGGLGVSVLDRVTVQLANRWAVTGEEPMIAQMFRTFALGKDVEGKTAQELQDEFYTQWLQYQIYPYVSKGNFLTSTAALYAAAQDDGLALTREIASLPQSGATEDVYLTQLTGGVPQRIRMFVWLEGQDIDCINTAAEGSFAISIELAGSNAS